VNLRSRLVAWRWQFYGNPVLSIQSRFDTIRLDTSRSRFVTPVKSIRYKLTLLEVVSIQNTITVLYINDLNEPSKTYSLERTQTSFVNETNPYLRDQTDVPKPAPK